MLRTGRLLVAVAMTGLLWAGGAQAANIVRLNVLNGTPCQGDGSVRCFNLGEEVQVETRFEFTDPFDAGSIELGLTDNLADGSVLKALTFSFVAALIQDPDAIRIRNQPAGGNFPTDRAPVIGFGFDKGPLADGDGIPFDPAIFPVVHFNGRVGIFKFLAQGVGQALISPKSGVLTADNNIGEFSTYDTFRDARVDDQEVTNFSNARGVVPDLFGTSVRVIPEPGTLLLLGFGLTGLAASRRRGA
jgi:hypothetical protein